MLIELRDVARYYQMGDERIAALDGSAVAPVFADPAGRGADVRGGSISSSVVSREMSIAGIAASAVPHRAHTPAAAASGATG